MTKEELLGLLEAETGRHDDYERLPFPWDRGYHAGYIDGVKFAYRACAKYFRNETENNLENNKKEYDYIMLKNLTPHVINVFINDTVMKTIIPEERPARCTQSQRLFDVIDGIPINRTTYGEVYDLPLPQEGVYYIVSKLVAEACPDRKDLLIPGALIRDEGGRVKGCHGLVVI